MLQDISVFNNTIIDFDANGIKVGTAPHRPIERLSFVNNTIKGARFGGICIESVDGSKVNDVHVNGLKMSHVSQPIFIRLARRNISKAGEAATKPGSIGNVLIENVRVMNPGTDTIPSNTITGIPEAQLGSIVIRNAYIEMPGGQNKVPQVPAKRMAPIPNPTFSGCRLLTASMCATLPTLRWIACPSKATNRMRALAGERRCDGEHCGMYVVIK